MEYIPKAIVLFIAVEHIYFLVLEMFLWTKPRTRKIFGTTPENAEATERMAKNQGLYNGFLAAGLIWGLLHPHAQHGLHVQTFFLSCVLVAGLYAGITVKKAVLLVQAAPAFIALCLLFLF